MDEGCGVVIQPATWYTIMRLPARDQGRALTVIEGLGISPLPSGEKKLEGAHNLYRVPSGDYRIICGIEDGHLVEVFLIVGEQPDLYRYCDDALANANPNLRK
jgi:mRNA-degrading endonuclease RelE of RelBE toxin-antitoxin system